MFLLRQICTSSVSSALTSSTSWYLIPVDISTAPADMECLLHAQAIASGPSVTTFLNWLDLYVAKVLTVSLYSPTVNQGVPKECFNPGPWRGSYLSFCQLLFFLGYFLFCLVRLWRRGIPTFSIPGLPSVISCNPKQITLSQLLPIKGNEFLPWDDVIWMYCVCFCSKPDSTTRFA